MWLRRKERKGKRKRGGGKEKGERRGMRNRIFAKIS